MKVSAITFTPAATVRFSNRELALMLKCSARHYDHRCRSIGVAGQGSFLYGWKMRREISPKIREETVSSDQLDTLMKVLEGGRHLPSVKDQRNAFGLGLNLRRTFIRVQECYGRTEKPGIILK